MDEIACVAVRALLAAAAFAGASALLPQAVQAQVGTPKWIQGGCAADNSGCAYIRVIKRNYPFITVKHKSTYDEECNKFYDVLDTELQFNCIEWKRRWRYYFTSWDTETNRKTPARWDSWGSWQDVLPGTTGETNMRIACG